MKTLCNLVVLGLFATIWSNSYAAADTENTVDTSAGKIKGILNENLKTVSYFGIPYAEPVKRFEQSKPLLVSSGSGKAMELSASPPACVQPPPLSEFAHPLLGPGSSEFSEDCLRVNVFKPADTKPDQRLPILVWVPGEGYTVSDMALYNGSYIASKGNIIVVTVNYRLGVFGFASMGNSTLPGNAALSDIVSAVQFIIANAGSFNGDPESVTLGGRFSGAMAISALLTMDSFYRENNFQLPLAQRIILHDGATTSAYTVESDPSLVFDKLAVATQCNKGDGDKTLKCLQELDSKQLMKLSSTLGYSWRPAINGIDMTKNPMVAIELGEFSSEIKIMIGENSGGGSLCDYTQKFLRSPFVEKIVKNTLSKDEFLSLAKYSLTDFFGNEDDTQSFLPIISHEFLYRRRTIDRTSWRDTFMSFCGSLYLRTPGELFARYASRLNAAVYRYEFDYEFSSSVTPSYLGGTGLGDEVPLLFPTGHLALNIKDQKVSDAFVGSLAAFVTKGDPSTTDVTWTLFSEMHKTMVRFTIDGIKVSTSEKLDVDVSFWRDVFKPMSRTLSRIAPSAGQDCKVPAEKTTQPNDGKNSNYLTVFFILVGTTGGLMLTIYLIRNRKKPYVWKS